MHLSKPLFFFLIALLISGVSMCAKAADNVSLSPDSQSLASHQNPIQSERPGETRYQFGLLNPAGDLGFPNSNVCYTMRSYNVKRTERLTDNKSGVVGYSTCQTASTYRFRSAEGQAPPKLK